jgi:hypothetical protein
MNLFKFLFSKRRSPQPAPQIDVASQLREVRDQYEYGNYELVVAGCDHILSLSPTNQEAYRIRSFAKYKLGDIEGASEDGKRAANLSS